MRALVEVWLSSGARARQAMYSAKSRVNACTGDPDWPLDVYRYQPPMGFETAGRLSEDRWRKSHQWCARRQCRPWRALLCGGCGL